jgi:hypothetical protein
MQVMAHSKNGGFLGVFYNPGFGFELPVPHQSRHARYLLRPVPSEISPLPGLVFDPQGRLHPLTLLSNETLSVRK